MKVLEKELHETRTTGAGAQQAAQLKTTELEASSQVSKDLQEQLSWLTTEKAAMEQRLQAKTAEVVGLHDKATTSEQQSCDLKTKNSRLEQEVGHLKKNLADVTQLNCKMSQVKLALEPVFVKTYRVHWVFCINNKNVYLASRHQVRATQVNSLQTGLFRASWV